MKKGAKYIFSADVIRCLAIFGVVIIHTANSVFERPDFFGGISWWLAIILNSASRICIPLFIMLSGFLLLRKGEKFSITFKRIIKRLFIPLVIWTTLIFVTSEPGNFSKIFSLDYLLRFLSGDVFYFYFLVILTGLYFISPLISSTIKNEKTQYLKKMAIFTLIAGALEVAAEYLANNCTSENSFTMWVPYLGIFLFGYLVASGRWKIKNSKWIKWLYLTGFLSTVALNYLYFSKGSISVLRILPRGCMTHYSDHYLSINVILMALAAFVLLFNFSYKFIKKDFWKKIIYKIARVSFGIYLLNISIVNIWDNYLHLDVDSFHIPLWSYIIIKFVAVFTISFILNCILVKIPIVKRAMGED
jgi:surface polysaccharide O-acyltransferase-like enzyme